MSEKIRIGNRLHELRKKKNITLEELSEKSGIAIATLSRMENNKMTGTVNAHQKICKVLGVSIATLYQALEEETKIVEALPEQKRAEHLPHDDKVKYELLVAKTLDKKILPVMIKISPDGKTQKEQNRIGVEKFIYVIEGALEAHIGKEVYSLKRGDSLYFDASIEHNFENPSKLDTDVICVTSPQEL